MEALTDKIKKQQDSSLYRHMQKPSGYDFSSNDYLGFVQNERLQKKIKATLQKDLSGSTGSRLLRGHSDIFIELETKLAQFSGTEEALYFSSGYQANLGLLSAVLGVDSVVFSDEYNHASLIDGIRLSGSEKVIFSHNDLDYLRELITRPTSKKKFIVIESLYSMSGDFAPLEAIVDLAKKNEAVVIVDEAHATGMFGAGRVQMLNLNKDVFATIHTAGKALGVAGAWIACNKSLKDFLVNFSRPFIYSTAPSPLVCRALLTSLEFWQAEGDELAKKCLEISTSFLQRLKDKLSVEVLGEAFIVSVVLKDNDRAILWAQRLQKEGFDIRAIRYPTVPKERTGLRISIHANHDTRKVDQLCKSLKALEETC